MASNRTTKSVIPAGWVNKKTMAASLGISVQAFGKWGVLPVARVGRESFFTVEDVVAYCIAQDRKKRSKHQPGRRNSRKPVGVSATEENSRDEHH